jgi:hypothetical protein
MTLPTRNGKDYLTIARFPKEFFISARKSRASGSFFPYLLAALLPVQTTECG